MLIPLLGEIVRIIDRERAFRTQRKAERTRGFSRCAVYEFVKLHGLGYERWNRARDGSFVQILASDRGRYPGEL